MKLLRPFLAAAFALAALPALAANACYTPAQLEAEQALRLHSELMVVTVTCRQGSEGQSLPAAYGDFTKKNIGYLHNAEQTMETYYKSTHRGDPVAMLDDLRTRLANEFGQKSADMSPDAFCAAYRDMVVQLDGASPLEVENQVQRMEASYRPYVKPCSGGATVVARKGR